MRVISRELFDIAEDFNLAVYADSDGVIGVNGEFRDFCGFFADLSIRLEQEGQAQIAFDLAKAVEYEEGSGEMFFDFVGYQFA